MGDDKETETGIGRLLRELREGNFDTLKRVGSNQFRECPFEPLGSDFRRKYLPFEYLPIDSELAAKFDSFKIISTGPTRFEHQPYHLYHGTSTQALDKILESGKLRTGASLYREGRLVWGEMKRYVATDGGYKPTGPKFLHPDALEKLGVKLSEKDRQIFGHACAVFFARHTLGCMGYTPDDPEQKAIIGVNRNALESRGHEFLDCGGEGIKCEGNISIDFGLQVLLVPDKRVDEYRQRVEGVYLASVYLLSDLDQRSDG